MCSQKSADPAHRARWHLITAGRLYPGAWRAVDQFRQARGRDVPTWPDWCYLPLAASYSIVAADAGVNRLDARLVGDVARLGALATWRVTQGIYRFDETLYQALIETPISGDIPDELLYRMPEWCVYIETPGYAYSGLDVHGFFAHLECDSNTGRTELRLLLDAEQAFTGLPLHLDGRGLTDAIAAAVAEAKRQAVISGSTLGIDRLPTPESARTGLDGLISLLLYLCSEMPDIPAWPPVRPTPKRTKHGWRLFAPDSPTEWDVGVRLGNALRQGYLAAESGHIDPDPQTGRVRPRAHVRRAHWHTYRIGVGRADSKLKWLPPIPVNLPDTGAIPATVRDVR